MILAKYEKQPAEVKDYDIDYSEWLNPVVDTVASTTAIVTSVTEAVPTLEIDSIMESTTTVKLWISGGTAGASYKVTVRMTTAGGRLDESELVFKVKDH